MNALLQGHTASNLQPAGPPPGRPPLGKGHPA